MAKENRANATIFGYYDEIQKDPSLKPEIFPLIHSLLRHADITYLHPKTGLAIMHYAVQHGDRRSMQKLITRSQDQLCLVDRNNHLPIHYATTNGDGETTAYLIKHGRKLHPTPHWAEPVGVTRTICDQYTKLIERPLLSRAHVTQDEYKKEQTFLFVHTLLPFADITYKRQTTGNAIIHSAASSGDVGTIQRLVDLNPTQLDMLSTSNHTPLHWALENNQPASTMCLLEMYAKKPKREDNWLRSGDEWVDLAVTTERLAIWAASNGHLEILQFVAGVIENPARLERFTAAARKFAKSDVARYLGNSNVSLSVGEIHRNIHAQYGTDELRQHQYAVRSIAPKLHPLSLVCKNPLAAFSYLTFERETGPGVTETYQMEIALEIIDRILYHVAHDPRSPHTYHIGQHLTVLGALSSPPSSGGKFGFDNKHLQQAAFIQRIAPTFYPIETLDSTDWHRLEKAIPALPATATLQETEGAYVLLLECESQTHGLIQHIQETLNKINAARVELPSGGKVRKYPSITVEFLGLNNEPQLCSSSSMPSVICSSDVPLLDISSSAQRASSSSEVATPAEIVLPPISGSDANIQISTAPDGSPPLPLADVLPLPEAIGRPTSSSSDTGDLPISSSITSSSENTRPFVLRLESRSKDLLLDISSAIKPSSFVARLEQGPVRKESCSIQ